MLKKLCHFQKASEPGIETSLISNKGYKILGSPTAMKNYIMFQTQL